MAETVSARIRVGERGRIVIPAELRREMHLEQGEVLVGRVEDGRLVLERRMAILGRLQARFAAAIPEGTSLVEELIADRRDEARRGLETQ